MTTEDLVSRLDGVKRSPSGIMARCPAHDDKHQSLSVGTGDDGRILVNCFVGCAAEDIVGRLGLEMFDLMPPRDEEVKTVYVVKDRSGKLVAEHIRVETPGGKKFFWRRNGSNSLGGLRVVEVPLYGIDQVKGQRVVVCEGEKSADALRKIVPAVATVCGASACPSGAVLADLGGMDVVLWPDADKPGEEHMARIAKALGGIAQRVRTVIWPEAPKGGDAADFMRAHGEHALSEFRALEKRTEGESESGLPLRFLHEAIPNALENLDRYHEGDFSRCVSTGVSSLDRRLGGGMHRGRMILVGAPTGAGKTTLLVSMAVTAAQTGPVLLVSPEMGADELAQREIIRRSQIRQWDRNPWRQRPDRDSAAELHLKAASAIMGEKLPLVILDSPDVDMEMVESAAEEVKQRHGSLSMVAIDYAQQVASPDPRTPRYLSVGAIGTRSVAIARTLDVAVLVASQVNVVKDGRNVTYAFRETQILEHKASTVLLFVVEWGEDGAGDRYMKSAEFRCTKMRNGGAFSLPVSYRPDLFFVGNSQTDGRIA